MKIQRDIQFRAWDKKEKKMIWNVESGRTDLTFYHYLELNRFILMQYTGLKDSNGKEIYEGDIVESELDLNGKSEKFRDEVKWGNIVDFRVQGVGFEFSGDIDFDKARLEDYEVIGNIYENKELLK